MQMVDTSRTTWWTGVTRVTPNKAKHLNQQIFTIVWLG